MEHYLGSGHLAAESLRETLAEAGEALEGLSPVLDFGCNSGRVLRHLHGPDELVAYRPGGARDFAQDEVLLRRPHTPVRSGRSAQAP